MIGLPPAGGWVTFNAIISMTAIPTARPKAKKKTVLSCVILNNDTKSHNIKIPFDADSLLDLLTEKRYEIKF